ncbi:LOW QUALITY PROTEIN: hypothetical protein Gmet_3607 [Geobacter metallireducens GS-15]|uniref:Uncharacterized protein n=1 Tax=Geobacter metallireducens (strain ATCC 53774 / DSM 7210 / GS-15) TaxID=269799 RepID=J7M0A0_GEOMG|nr:LOW QUALITY PROTEIN: hypothetical protein Gmet_3607 [Geobacter metallireducens GS-15]
MSSIQLFTRNSRYYHLQWIPPDLRSLHGERVEPVKPPLKTADRKQAQGLASGRYQKYTVTSSLLRSGLLAPDQTPDPLAEDSPKKRKDQAEAVNHDVSPPRPHPKPLAQLFIEEHSPSVPPGLNRNILLPVKEKSRRYKLKFNDNCCATRQKVQNALQKVPQKEVDDKEKGVNHIG